MAPFERLFGRKPSEPEERPRMELPALCEVLARRRPALERKEVEPALVRARLADFHRDQGLETLPPETFRDLLGTLDREGLRRLALVTDALEAPAVDRVVAALARARGVETQVGMGFVGFAAMTPLLTLELLGQSPLRLEELARRWTQALGAGIAGETEKESAQRLERLDYGKLLEEAERAKQAAETRQAKLKKLREEKDVRAARGKW
jgi:hypothetical protein